MRGVYAYMLKVSIRGDVKKGDPFLSLPHYFAPQNPARDRAPRRVSVPKRVRTPTRKYCDSLSDPLRVPFSLGDSTRAWFYGAKLRLRLGGEIFSTILHLWPNPRLKMVTS